MYLARAADGGPIDVCPVDDGDTTQRPGLWRFSPRSRASTTPGWSAIASDPKAAANLVRLARLRGVQDN